MVGSSPARIRSLVGGGAALAALYLVVFAILGSAAFARAPAPIALAVTFDLTVTATFLVWWFGVRPQLIPGWIAVAVFSWGITMARAWVPHAPIGTLIAAGGVVEVLAIGWLLVRIRRVVRVARAARELGPIGAIEAGLVAVRIPARVAAILSTEIAVVGLVLTGWFRRPRPDALSMRSTGWLLFAGVIGFLIIVETAALHILLAMWSPLVAWISTASSGYALLWLAGDAQAIRLYPVAVEGGMLRVTVGIRWRAMIPLSAIASVTEVRAVPPGALNLGLFEPTVLVTLRAPVEVRGLLGRTRHADRLALTIDDPKAFAAACA
ncbi:MAG TPA: hypothetical protein VHN14_28545 [Kofleriaceae bacterium]|jgi:hypothetical protein|nr:hypothetical protein [Kofleriaceae bacterium]